MSDDLDELDAALRRAMAALDGEAPAGYFEALPGRTLARLDDPALGTALGTTLGELPEDPGRTLRAVQGLRPPDDDGDDEDDGAVFSSQIMAAVELPEADELSEPAQPGARPRRDRASASSSIMRAVEGAAGGGERAEVRLEPASASSVGMRAVAVDVEAGELGDPRETRVAGSDLGARSTRSKITGLPVSPVEPARPATAVGVRSTGAAASMTEAGRGRRGRLVRAAIVGIGGIGLAAVAVMYLRGDRPPRGAASSAPSIVSNRGPASPSAGGSAVSSLAAGSAASADPAAGGNTVSSAKPAGAASAPGAGSAATPATAAGSGVAPDAASGPVSKPVGKLGELVKRPGKAGPLSKGGGKPEAQLAPGAAGKGAAKQVGVDAPPSSDESGVPGKKLKSAKPRPDRTSLSGDDIERAMTAVAGQARACFTGTRGTASLRLTVAPSGRIVQVTVTGPFAGTPEGACVERAVQAATFPSWSGAAQSFDHSYLLSD